jgi:hypothetical protein
VRRVRKAGRLDPDHPAAVVVTLYDNGTGPLVVRLAPLPLQRRARAHSHREPDRAGDGLATRWRRTAIRHSHRPRVHAACIAAGGDLLDVLLSALLAIGFRLLTAPHSPLPVLPGRLHVRFAIGRRLRVTDAAGNTLYDGTLPIRDGWAELATVTGLIGIVVCGLDLHDHDRDHFAPRSATAQRSARPWPPAQPHPRTTDPPGTAALLTPVQGGADPTGSVSTRSLSRLLPGNSPDVSYRDNLGPPSTPQRRSTRLRVPDLEG